MGKLGKNAQATEGEIYAHLPKFQRWLLRKLEEIEKESSQNKKG